MSLTPASDMLRTDHRQIEVWIDRLLEVAKHPTPHLVIDVRRIFAEIQSLTAPHFDKEESVLYPRLRPIVPDLLAQMDEQHTYIREVEENLQELIATVGDEPSDRELTELVRFSVELFDTVQHHIVDEEDVLAFSLAQVLVGGGVAHYRADPTDFYGFDLSKLWCSVYCFSWPICLL